VKPRIYCFGHGWALETSTKIQYVGSWQEAFDLLNEQIGYQAINVCLDIYRARMGQIDTRGMA